MPLHTARRLIAAETLVKTALQATTSDTRQTGTALKLCAMLEFHSRADRQCLFGFQKKVNKLLNTLLDKLQLEFGRIQFGTAEKFMSN